MVTGGLELAVVTLVLVVTETEELLETAVVEGYELVVELLEPD